MMGNKKFIEGFEGKVKKTIEDYLLLSRKDKIIVACSGGKDSTTVLYLLHKFGYKVEGLIIDLLIGSWSKRNLENTKKFCLSLGVKLHVVNLREEFGGSMCFFRTQVQEKLKLTNCMICGVIKRWLINRKARELKGTKLVTGHNLDDGAETVMMNLFKGNLGLITGMGPKVGRIKDKKFVPRVKPLYFCLNSEVRRYAELKGFPVVYEDCPCLVDSFRKKIRLGLAEEEKKNPKVKENIVGVFLEILPRLQRKYQDKEERKEEGKIKYCERCGEPSRGKICRMCQMLGGLR